MNRTQPELQVSNSGTFGRVDLLESLCPERYVIEGMDYQTDEYAVSKAGTHPQMAYLGRLITIDSTELEHLAAEVDAGRAGMALLKTVR